MEDQIAKYTKEIFEIENENKLLQSENTKLKQEMEMARIKQIDLDTRNEKLETECRHLADELRNVLEKTESMACDNDDVDEEGSSIEQRWQEIISELEERIEVCTCSEYFIPSDKYTRFALFSSLPSLGNNFKIRKKQVKD